MTSFPYKLLLTLLAFIVITYGAYVRLTDAGLGCPDWPGCYGKLIPQSGQGIEDYNSRKAWDEMIHRYLASFLGLGILILSVGVWKHRKPATGVPSEVVLVPLVIFQGALGMWTVTLLLKPIVVTAHLIGGISTLSLLWWSVLKSSKFFHYTTPVTQSKWFSILLGVTFFALVFQIFLGGWTSTNYAALACTDLPKCHGRWIPETNFTEAFQIWRGLGTNYEFGILDSVSRSTIHFTHRFWAVVTTILIFALSLHAYFSGNYQFKVISKFIFIALFVQVFLGVMNIKTGLSLSVAVAHNAVAALLVLTVVTMIYAYTNNRRKHA